MLLHFTLLSSVLYAVVTQGASNEPPTTNITQNASLGYACSKSEWQCADGSCISKEGRCNAVVDCRDASDEYQDTCEGIERPIFRLQMLCLSLLAKSQRICPQICYDQPAFCYYALMAENGRPNTCRFPEYPAHGKYTVQPLVDRPAAEGFRLNYTCDQSYALVESEKLDCVNGTWLNGDKPHYCAESCRLFKADNFTYVCQTGSCGDHVPVGTVVTVTRKGTERDAVSIQILCNEDKAFNISSDCVIEIDNMQQNFENPAMIKMTSYESQFNQLKYNDTTPQFQKLVEDFHKFENEVRGNLTMMHRLSEQCDMYLDLFLYDLAMKHRSMSNR